MGLRRCYRPKPALRPQEEGLKPAAVSFFTLRFTVLVMLY